MQTSQFNLSNAQAKIADLDEYTQRSVYGAWQYFANSQCISQLVRKLPDTPRDSGIDGYTTYEHQLRVLKDSLAVEEGDFQSPIGAFIALQRDIHASLLEIGADSRDLEDTHAFLCERKPSKSQFEAEYAERVRLGMRPGITRTQFVEHELARAMDQHDKLVAKGQDAIQMLNSIVVPETRSYDDLPDWAFDALKNKLIQKLHDRWMKLELTRTNPRTMKQRRDEAEGNQILITELLKDFGEVPGMPVEE